VILDEAHRIKDPHSKQTRAIWAVAHDPSVQFRYALTGTPIANHVGDLWSIYHFLDPDEHATKSKFVDRYALQSWNAYGGLDIVGVNPDTRAEFFGVIDPRFRRTHKELVLDQLPEKIRTQRWVEMGTKQAKAYKDLKTQLTTIMDDGEILVAKNNLVRDTRLMQLASSYGEVEWVENPVTPKDKCRCFILGYDRHEDICPERMTCVVRLTEPSPKLDAMEDILDELGGKPCIIAAESKQLIMLAAGRFKNNRKREKFGLITGDQDEWERQKVITQLNEGDLNAVLMTIAAGGTGIDGLQVADTMIILQRSWSMVGNIQLEGRIDRIGSGIHDSIHYIDIVTRNTIEETRLWPRLAEKLERLEEINRDRAQLLRAGQNTYDLDTEEARISASMV
jgi:SNF2 family DNA or RNA helicase